jgi:hypothetical protein
MQVPPFKILATTLRKTTERLARELAEPSPSAPSWTDLEWAVARSVAAMQGISVLFANNLRWPGPPSWQAFLAEQRAQSLQRDTRIGALLESIDKATHHAQIGCVALKGAALRTLDLYRPSERPMADVDLLVRAADLPALRTAIGRLGYVEAFTTRRHSVYEPGDRRAVDGFGGSGFGEHNDNPLKIEVHTRVAEALPVRPVDITLSLWPEEPQPGLNWYADLAALMRHLLLHAAGNIRAHALRLIQLYDIAALAARFGGDDWRGLIAEPRNGERLWWAFPPLALVARYWPSRIPAEVIEELRAACPRMLRFATERQTLTDVSWSNLRIHAFPGIAWSRSLGEAARFMRDRALPGRDALAGLQLALRAQPQLGQVPWYGLSHGNRILRWLFSRPPRVQTMTSVVAALERAESSAD